MKKLILAIAVIWLQLELFLFYVDPWLILLGVQIRESKKQLQTDAMFSLVSYI